MKINRIVEIGNIFYGWLIIHEIESYTNVGKTYPGTKMIKAISNSKDKRGDVWYETPTFCHCKDFLCPPETKIQEWFPTELQARLRAKALDPFGLMLEKNQGLDTIQKILCKLGMKPDI